MFTITALWLHQHTCANVLPPIDVHWYEYGESDFKDLVNNIGCAANLLSTYSPREKVDQMQLSAYTSTKLIATVKRTNLNDSDKVIKDCYLKISLFCDRYIAYHSKEFIERVKYANI